MNNYITDTVLMVEPVGFSYNHQTAKDNSFQQKISKNIQKEALSEFSNAVKLLLDNGINVKIIKDTKSPKTPDSIFPNNWITFHENNRIVLYPMYAPNRRGERRIDVFNHIYEQNKINEINIIDLTSFENSNYFLEGTGSIVFDRINKFAYASISKRTNINLFQNLSILLGYEPIHFHSYSLNNKCKKIIYHTNVMLMIADEYAIICSDSILDKNERQKVLSHLGNNKDIMIISDCQMRHFVANSIQLINDDKDKLLIMSTGAYNALTEKQKKFLSQYNKILPIPLSIIEKVGGGGIRCMLAEIFT